MIIALAIYTKPADESFHYYYSGWFKGYVGGAIKDNTGIASSFISTIVSSIASNVGTYHYMDYFLLKVVHVKYPQQTLEFVGVFGTWFPTPTTITALQLKPNK